MKILQITAHFSPNVGGVETHLDDLVRVLSKKNDVFVLTYRPLTTKASWKVYDEKENIKILRLPWIPGFFYAFVKNPFFEFLYLLPGLFFATPIVIFRENPYVIHSHGLVAGFVGIFWGKVFKKKVVISLHSIYHFPPEGLYSSFVKWIFQNAHKVLCLSRQSKEEVIALGIKEENVVVFTYWIDQSLFHRVLSAKEKLNMSNKFVVLFVGRLVQEKGIIELLKSAEKWNKDIILFIAGTGPLEKLVTEKEDKKNIIYVGKISQAQLPLYYSAADVLIIPSIHEEGFGRVILESLSCGTPVIASNRGGIKEAINNDMGYLIDINPENIKKAVEYCYEHKNELKKKSDEAVEFSKKHYSEKNAEDILHAYE